MTVTNPLTPGDHVLDGVCPLLAGILTTTHERHVDMIDLIRDLPDHALSWRPGPQMSSLAGIVRHVMDDETEFVRSLVAMPNGWPGVNGEWMDATGTAAELIALIADGDVLLKRVFPTLTDERLRQPHRASGTQIGQELVEMADHSSMHYGHMQITRHLYEQAHPAFVSHYQHWQ